MRPDTLTHERFKRWLLVALWTAFIYSIIPIGRPLANYFEKATQFEFLLNLGYIAIVFSLIVILFWKRGFKRLFTYFVFIGSLLLFSLLMFTTRFPVEKIHLVEYCLLSIFIFRAVYIDFRNLFAWLITIVAVSFIGWGEEFIQYFVPNRVYDIFDIALNTTGGFFGLIFTSLVLLDRKLS